MECLSAIRKAENRSWRHLLQRCKVIFVDAGIDDGNFEGAGVLGSQLIGLADASERAPLPVLDEQIYARSADGVAADDPFQRAGHWVNGFHADETDPKSHVEVKVDTSERQSRR